MARTIAGYFRDRASADAAYDDLVSQGFSKDDISILGRGAEGRGGLADDDTVSAGQGAALGGITGLLLGAAAMLIPGIGPIVAVGPISAALAGAVTGGVTGVVVGGITGALIDAGVDEDTAGYYNERLAAGGVLLTVRANDMEVDKARMILEHHDGDVRRAEGGMATVAGTSGAVAGDWDTVRGGYRDRWQQRFGTTGGRWEEYEPSYRYGWEMRSNPTYRGRSWTDVEPDLRRDWEGRHHDMPWDRAGMAIRDVWDDVTHPGGVAPSRERTVQLREEELHARKETVEAGEVAIRKDVVTEQKSVSVPVTHEEVVIERRPVEPRPAGSGSFGEGREEIRVPVHEEKVHLEKQPVVTEEVRVSTRPVQETEQVSGTVRREEAHVEREGDVQVRDTSPRPGARAHEHHWVDGRCECGVQRP